MCAEVAFAVGCIDFHVKFTLRACAAFLFFFRRIHPTLFEPRIIDLIQICPGTLLVDSPQHLCLDTVLLTIDYTILGSAFEASCDTQVNVDVCNPCFVFVLLRRFVESYDGDKLVPIPSDQPRR